MRAFWATVLSIVCSLLSAASTRGESADVFKGAFLGQTAPGVAPELFADEAMTAWGIRKTPHFSSDGREMFWSTERGRFQSALMTSRLTGGEWTKPQPLPFSTGVFFDHNPILSADGHLLIFASNRPIAGKEPTTIPGTPVPTSDLWMSTRAEGTWSDPVPLGPSFNTPYDDDSPALAADGTLYFSSSRPGAPGPGAMYAAKRNAAGWSEPSMLPAVVNTTAGEMVNFVAPDQSYLIFWSMRSGGEAGLYVSHKTDGGTWGTPARTPDAVNRMRAYSAAVVDGGRALVFTSSNGGKAPRIYWMDAKFLRDDKAAEP